MKVVALIGVVLVALIVSSVLGIAVLLGGMGHSSTATVPTQGATISALSNSTIIDGQHPPAFVVSIDEKVASMRFAHGTCQIPARVLLSQQLEESGWNPDAASSVALGLAQFKEGTWKEYSQGLPPPDIRRNPLDSAMAEARYLCSLNYMENPMNAFITYRCGGLTYCRHHQGVAYALTIIGWAEGAKA